MTTYHDAVTEFRQLDDSIETGQWRQAQITWEQLEAGKSAKQWARDVGKSDTHVRTLYKVWDAKSTSRLTATVSFNEAYQQATDGPDWEEKQALRRAKSALRQLPPERQVEVMEDASDELPAEQQAQLVDRWTDPLTKDERARVSRDHKDREREIKARLSQQPDAADFNELNLIGAMTNLRLEVEGLVAEWSHRSLDPSPEAADILAQELAGIKRGVELIAEIIQGGEGMDAELQRLVKEHES